ncbi:hypothetical protein K438DRAFT_2028671 [Mycena galopus ATCC 62051]|nr:hypothetical protein K438DRAFT_2028671 [Mycena galopus ATCC 62051]
MAQQLSNTAPGKLPGPSRSSAKSLRSISHDAGGQSMPPVNDGGPPDAPRVVGDMETNPPLSTRTVSSVQSQSSPPTPPPAEDSAVQNLGNSGDGGSRIRLGTSHLSQRKPSARKRFGLNKGEQTARLTSTDYRQNSGPVWNVYNDESAFFDNDMINECGDNLDVLLIFAGLFSAVLTTFVAQTSQALSPDNTVISNSILLELVSLQRAQANGTSFDSISSADTSFTAAPTDIWVNGLWFTSLSLSLATALLAVLAKQWLHQYSSFLTGSACERALIRQFRYTSFDRWGVQFIISLLPTVLHLSLLLFMAGLTVFLYALDHTIAGVVASITGFLYVVYTVMIALPIAREDISQSLQGSIHTCPENFTPWASIHWVLEKETNTYRNV